MAQTKRKRRTKHRGNAAGHGRGARAHRPQAEGRPSARRPRRKARLDRFGKPPTWRSAMQRAAIAAILFVAA